MEKSEKKKFGIEMFLATIQIFLYCQMSTSSSPYQMLKILSRMKRGTQPHLLYVTSGKGMHFVFLFAVISKPKSKKRANQKSHQNALLRQDETSI